SDSVAAIGHTVLLLLWGRASSLTEIYPREREILGENNEFSDTQDQQQEQIETTNKSEINESFIISDEEHHSFITTCSTKPEEDSSSGYFSDLSHSSKHELGSVSSQEDIECGYFSHSSGSTSHSSSSEKLVQDHDQIVNDDDDDDNSTNNVYNSRSSENFKQDDMQTIFDDDAIDVEHREHNNFEINNDYKKEWNAPAAPSNSPTDAEQTNTSRVTQCDLEEDSPITFQSINEDAYDKYIISKKYPYTHSIQNISKEKILSESKKQYSSFSNVFESKSHHIHKLKRRITTPLRPNTLTRPPQVIPTKTSIQVRYPPPNTSAIYYDNLPEPKEEEVIDSEKKDKRLEQDEFINVLRDKLKKLQISTGGSQSKNYDDVFYDDDIAGNDDDKDDDDKDDDNDIDDKDDDDDSDGKYNDDDIDGSANSVKRRAPLKRQSSFTMKIPQKNLSNLTEVLSNLHKTQTAQKKCENLPSKESLTNDPKEESNDTKKVLTKSSSLKYDKTPPDQKQQSQKKIVKFADVFGMDLVEVRTFMAGAPAISQSSFSDTQVELPTCCKTRSLRSLFDAPIAKSNFWDLVNRQKVSLEQMFIGKDLSVKGIIRVLNITCDKRITIKHSFDNWKNSHETTATYLSGSSDGRTDQFSFLLWGNFLQDNGTLVFCIRYQTAGQEYWDNNQGEDYKLQCYAMPSKCQGQSQERSSRSRQQQQQPQPQPQQPSQYLMAQSESLYSNFQRLREHSPHDPWIHRYL
ncbi:unnamed protein product, partial [Meganyctiphanes norvegica]